MRKKGILKIQGSRVFATSSTKDGSRDGRVPFCRSKYHEKELSQMGQQKFVRKAISQGYQVRYRR